jgi:metallo-beta-lactamase family protein
MAKVATKVFFDHPEDHREGLQFSRGSAEDKFLPARFETTVSADDSLLACMREGPMIVISAAGMLNGGRILHHLKARLPNPENTILFCGYQAEGTKGRILQDRPDHLTKLRIHHKEFAIEAEIATIGSLSAHGDSKDIKEWLQRMSKAPSHIIINHGDPSAVLSMAAIAQNIFPKASITPLLKPTYLKLF